MLTTSDAFAKGAMREHLRIEMILFSQGVPMRTIRKTVMTMTWRHGAISVYALLQRPAQIHRFYAARCPLLTPSRPGGNELSSLNATLAPQAATSFSESSHSRLAFGVMRLEA
jgi:hypothetical protein